MYTNRVTIIGKGGEDDKELIKLLSKNYLLKYVVADSFGNFLHNGSPVRQSFFDLNSDVVLIAPSLDNDSSGIRDILDHKLPIAHSAPYNGIFNTAGSKIIWKKYLPKDLVMTPKVHYVVGGSADLNHSRELFRKIQLPVRVHYHCSEGKVVQSFDELHNSLDEAMKLSGHAYVEDNMPGDILHLITVPDFRNELLYKFPIMIKSNHEYIGASHISDDVRNRLMSVVEKLHQDLGLNHATQFDFVINKKGVYLRDINTNPQKHNDSVFVHAMKHVGANMGDFWHHVVERAREEFEKNK